MLPGKTNYHECLLLSFALFRENLKSTFYYVFF